MSAEQEASTSQAGVLTTYCRVPWAPDPAGFAEADGDIGVVPAVLADSHAGLETALGAVLAADAVPVVLGGDHSLSLPTLRALAARHGRDGYSVIHFDCGLSLAHHGRDRRARPAGGRRRRDHLRVGAGAADLPDRRRVDVLDPAYAPGTGTPSQAREVITSLGQPAPNPAGATG